MKVVYFHQYFSTPRGAAGIRSYVMARRLVARGHEVLMVCGSAARGQTGLDIPFERSRRRGFVDGIEVLEFDLGYSNTDGFVTRTIVFLKFAFSSVRVALGERYDLAFATTTPLTAGIPGVFAKWIRRKFFVFEVRDLWPELPKAMGVIRNPLVLAAMSMLEFVSYHSANVLIALSPGIVDGIARRGVPRSRIAMIPNGSDLELFASDGTAWRPQGVKATELMAVFAGAHGIANGLDAVLDAAGELQRQGATAIKIVLVGDGKLKPDLQRRAANDGLTNVIFHEPVSKLRLAGLMAATDVGLQILDNVPAFYYGTSPNKFFDYIASGLPVLINYPGWLADVVTETRCGYAIPPSDAKAFARALIHAREHREELVCMGKRSLELARTRFSTEMLSNTLVDFLERSVLK